MPTDRLRILSMLALGVAVLTPALILAQQSMKPGSNSANPGPPTRTEVDVPHHAGEGDGSWGRNEFLMNGGFINIPGPNPILRRGDAGAWDERLIEAGDAFAEFGTYYLSYHARAMENTRWPGGYQIGLATAPNPLGPFTKHGDKPILSVGPKGSWDDEHVACPKIVKVEEDKYYLWYCGRSSADPPNTWHVGLASAPVPEGPWTKHGNRPVLDDFGYVGGVVVARGKYYLYAAHPVGSTSPDYGFMKVATADAPEGPWIKWPNNPVLAPGAKGTFDEGGFSESEVEYSSGVFHMFYDGARYHKEGGRRTAIGYAYSFDGFHFTKYSANPVAATQMPGRINVWESKELPKGARMMAETHMLIESPFIYLYSTIRPHEANPIGVQVLATKTPFQLEMPVLMLPTIPPGRTTPLDASPPLSLSNVTRVALTAEGTYTQSSKGAIRIHVRSSYDGLNYDTSDLQTFDVEHVAGQIGRKTVTIDSPVRFIKVCIENLDPAHAVSNVKVTATLGS